MKCEDCIHDNLCDMWAVESGIPFVNPNICEHFKNKADFVEVVRCGECAYREECNKEIYVERSYTSIYWCSEGKRK